MNRPNFPDHCRDLEHIIIRVKAGNIDTLCPCIPVIEVIIVDGLNFDHYGTYA